jgi:phage-related protein
MNGVKFDDIHSYYDLNLILSECTISPATPKTNFVDIPGASKSIDLTEALGTVVYNDRIGKLVFSVLPTDDFEKKKSEIANTLNHRFKITLDKDPDYYYVGRCSVNDWKSDKMSRQIVCDLRLQPYKIKHDVIEVEVTTPNEYHMLLVNLKVEFMPVIPTIVITGSGSTEIIHNGSTAMYSPGTYIVPEYCLYAGDNTFTVSQPETNKLKFIYQEGSL